MRGFCGVYGPVQGIRNIFLFFKFVVFMLKLIFRVGLHLGSRSGAAAAGPADPADPADPL